MTQASNVRPSKTCMLEPTHRLQELAGWLLLLFNLIWLAGFSLLIANACLFGDATEIGIALAALAFTAIGRILTHYRSENRPSRLIAWLGAKPLQVVQETMQPGNVQLWLKR